MPTRKFEVGQRVWKFEDSRRIYTKAASPKIWGDLIYSEHFVPHAITGSKAAVT